MKTDERLAPGRQQRGFTLIEAMVALVVLSIGLLGMASMQVGALRLSTSAYYRSIAATKASELAERMRANLPGVYDNDYIIDSAPDCSSAPASLCASGTGETEAALCDTSAMAAFDLYEVSCVDGIADLLPNGDLSIACNDSDTSDADACTDGSSFAISVSWQANVDFERDTENPELLIVSVLPGPGA